MEAKNLQIKNKQEIQTSAEHTRPGITFTPAVDIFETEGEITLIADLPGVKAENLTIDLHDNTLTLIGDIENSATKDEIVYKEYDTGRYYRQFSLSDVIDQSKIEAELKDGVLRLKLPKVAKAVPRKIVVKTI